MTPSRSLGSILSDPRQTQARLSPALRCGLMVVAAMVVLPVVPAYGQCASSFAGAVNYGAHATPGSVVIGDVNGDGRPDLAAANANGDVVSVLLGNGNGTFAAAVNYPIGNGSHSLAIGDVSGDGWLDLVTANRGDNNLSVLLNNGDGTFAAAVNYAGANPSAVAIGDLNGDGWPDLAVANRFGNIVSVRLNNGNGTFAAAVNYATAGRSYSVAIGDVSGDGKPDLAVANENTNNVSVLLGNGNGTFGAAVNYGAGTAPSFVAIGDVSGDGKPDLAVTNVIGANVSVLLGNGDGTFAAAVNYGVVGAQPQSVAIGEVNGDGKPDLAVANYNTDNVSVLLGNGNGTFAAAVNYGTGFNSLPNSVAIGDVNGDGKPDLATANANSNNLSVLLNNGPSIAISPQPVSQSVAAGANVIFTVTASGTGSLTYQWRRNGLPVLNSARISGATTGTLTINNVTAADADAYDVQVRGGCNPTAVATSKTAVLTVGICKGDFNDDNQFNAADIQDIVDALLAGQTCP